MGAPTLSVHRDDDVYLMSKVNIEDENAGVIAIKQLIWRRRHWKILLHFPLKEHFVFVQPTIHVHDLNI